MSREEIQKLFNLIETLYPSAKKNPRTPAVIEAWALVLEPWSYEAAKQAVVVRARENRFPPDASELVPYLPKPETPKAEEVPMPEPSDAYLEKFYAKCETLHERWKAAGIPTPSEAKKRGMTYAGWESIAKGAGV